MTLHLSTLCRACNGTGDAMSSMTVTSWCRSCSGTGEHEVEAPEREELKAELDDWCRETDALEGEPQVDGLLAEAANELLSNHSSLADLPEFVAYVKDVALAWAEEAVL